MSNEVIVLSLDGGGVRGLFQAELLHKINDMLGGPIQKKVDMIIGTSIGGILSLLLSQNHEYINLPSLFCKENMKKVFSKCWWWHGILAYLKMSPIYDGKGKTELIEKYLKNIRMEDLEIDTAITSYQIGNFHPNIITSWGEGKDIPIRKVADMTSAAPVYFPSVEYNGNWFLDGGIGINNPSILAYIIAKEKYPDKKIKVLSLGTGCWMPKYDGKESSGWGSLEWLVQGQITDLLMSASNRAIDMYCESVIGDSFLRLNHRDIVDIPLDDISDNSIKKLRQAAQETFSRHKDRILEFLNTE